MIQLAHVGDLHSWPQLQKTQNEFNGRLTEWTELYETRIKQTHMEELHTGLSYNRLRYNEFNWRLTEQTQLQQTQIENNPHME